MAGLGLLAMSELFLVLVSGGYSLIASPRFLTVVASLDAAHGLYGAWASVVATCRARTH